MSKNWVSKNWVSKNWVSKKTANPSLAGVGAGGSIEVPRHVERLRAGGSGHAKPGNSKNSLPEFGEDPMVDVKGLEPLTSRV